MLELTRNGPALTRHVLSMMGTCLFISILLMFSWDSAIAQFFARPELGRLWVFAREATHIGLSEHYFIAAVVVFIYFKWLHAHNRWLPFKEERSVFLRKWSLNFLGAMIAGGIVLHLIKFFVGRARPHKTAPFFDAWTMDPITTHWHWHSFPSGHSQTMFAVATMMSIAFPKFTWAWIIFAGLIASTRVIIHDHFLSDVVFGSCLGYCMSLVAVYLIRRYTRQGI